MAQVLGLALLPPGTPGSLRTRRYCRRPGRLLRRRGGLAHRRLGCGRGGWTARGRRQWCGWNRCLGNIRFIHNCLVDLFLWLFAFRFRINHPPTSHRRCHLPAGRDNVLTKNRLLRQTDGAVVETPKSNWAFGKFLHKQDDPLCRASSQTRGLPASVRGPPNLPGAHQKTSVKRSETRESS